MAKNKSIPAYLALGAGVVALSFSAMFVRWANAPGPVTAYYRMLISTAILLPLFVARARNNRALLSSSIIFPLLAGFFTACDLGLWTTAVGYTTASNATLLGNTSPLWVALGAWLIFRERLSRNFWLGLALALTGAFLIMGTDFILHPRLGIGDVMAIFTGFFYGCYFLATQRSREVFDPMVHIWLVGISASISLFAVNAALKHPMTGYLFQSWLVFIGTAIVSQIIGYMSLAYALGHLPARIVSPTMILQPVLTTILAIPLLGEIPSPIQIAGGLIALAGIYIINQSHSRPMKEIPEK